MKTFFLLLLIAIPFSAFSQEEDDDEMNPEEINFAIEDFHGTWQITECWANYPELEYSEVDAIMKDHKGAVFVFREDNTFTKTNRAGKVTSGTWRLVGSEDDPADLHLVWNEGSTEKTFYWVIKFEGSSMELDQDFGEYGYSRMIFIRK